MLDTTSGDTSSLTVLCDIATAAGNWDKNGVMVMMSFDSRWWLY